MIGNRQQSCSYNRQRMHNQYGSMDLPCRKKPNYFQKNNPLLEYIHSEEEIGDWPMQLSNNPYSVSRNIQDNKPKYTKNSNNSYSKCAVTEISNKGDEQGEESITPVCQQLFQNYHQHKGNKDYQLPITSPSEEIITQATFKPNDLKQYLRNQSKQKENLKLKKFLKETIFQTKQLPKKQIRLSRSKSNLTTKNIQDYGLQAKQKTKYEKILEQFFNNKSKKEMIKSRVSKQKLPNYKLQHLQYNPLIHQMKQSSIKNKIEVPSQNSTKHDTQSTMNEMQRSKSENFISYDKIKQNHKQRPLLVKTFSQSNIECKQRQNRHTKQTSVVDKWMAMSFEQRQSKTIQNRRQKQDIGQKQNRQKQIKNCTFKPITNCFKPITQKCLSGGSYAQLYYQKIRRKF